jgi:lipopolysaccharide biosynthesis glycosyltransferase
MTAMTAPRPQLTIVSNADERFFPGLAVAVASAAAAASGAFDYRFLILDGGLAKDSLQTLAGIVRETGARRGIRATLEPLEIDQGRLRALPERRGSRMTYAKLVLPEVLTTEDSLIYVDADVLCFRGLEAVGPPAGDDRWLLAGARDFFAVIAKDCPWIEQVPLAERNLPYINCGVMWMNLKGLREIDFTSRAIAARASIGNARQGDQAVFNFLCRGKSHILPDAVNHRTSLGSTRPLREGDLDLNLHYIGSPKPWLGPPITSTWLAHCLWHQAHAALIPGNQLDRPNLPPRDHAVVRRKALLYSLINPSRAAHCRGDLRSLTDPGDILAKAGALWKTRLG